MNEAFHVLSLGMLLSKDSADDVANDCLNLKKTLLNS